jgi:hypothetical protein
MLNQTRSEVSRAAITDDGSVVDRSVIRGTGVAVHGDIEGAVQVYL